jgi:hypothetical protein
VAVTGKRPVKWEKGVDAVKRKRVAQWQKWAEAVKRKRAWEVGWERVP